MGMQAGRYGIVALAVALVPLVTAAVRADEAGDPAKGEKVFKKCAACHAVGPEAKNKVGPVLNGIVGRPAASVADFAYSDAMKAKAAEGLVWTEEEIGHLLENPKGYAPGTKMSFAGLRKEEERADVIAYLATFAAP